MRNTYELRVIINELTFIQITLETTELCLYGTICESSSYLYNLCLTCYQCISAYTSLYVRNIYMLAYASMIRNGVTGPLGLVYPYIPVTDTALK